MGRTTYKWRLTALVMPVLMLAACGDSGSSGADRLPGQAGSRGAELVSELGCLSCHRIGSTGNRAPGPDLTHVGSRLTRERLERVLITPTAGMPSYSQRSQADRDAMTGYLKGLR